MSEFQSYEFRAIDQPLDAAAMSHLRSISTRGEITPYSFSNVYHWGDFKGNPQELLERYFDVFVYYANWGTRWCMIRLPKATLSPADLLPYLGGDACTWWSTASHDVVQFQNEHDEGPWHEYDEDAGGWIGELVGLRDELLRGDLRPLFVAWLHTHTWLHSTDPSSVVPKPHLADTDEAWDDDEADDEAWDDEGDDGEGWDDEADDEPSDEDDVGDEEDPADVIVPPVPAGLAAPTPCQQALAAFLYVEGDFLTAAGKHAPPPEPAADPAAMRAWLRKQPFDRKEDWLWQAMSGDAPRLGQQLRREFERTLAAPPRSAERWTLAQLLDEARTLRAERQREAQEHAERERLRREQEAAERRERHLQSITGRDAWLWTEVEQQTKISQPKAYDRAAELLVDLRDLAQRDGRLSEFELRVQEYRERHARKLRMLERLDKLGL